MSKTNSNNLSDEQIKEINLKDLNKRIKSTKSIDERKRLEKLKTEKEKENVSIYQLNPEEEQKTSEEFLREIREEGTKPKSSTGSPQSKPGKAKPINPFFKPKV